MNVFRFAAVAVAATILAAAEGSLAADKAAPPLTFVLMDGSVITGSPDESDLLVDTEFGRLKIPLGKVESFTPGLDSHPELGEKLQELVAALDEPDPARQEKAKKELIEMGPWFQAVLSEFADDLNPARKAAIAAILEAYKAAPADDRVEPVQWQDRVKTASFLVVGTVAQPAFKITTPYGVFGVDVNRIRQANASSGVAVRTDRKVNGVLVEASDGTKLVGQTDVAAVTIETPYGKYEIPLKLVDIVRASKKPAPKPGARLFEVVLWNEDRIEGVLVAPDTIAVRTEYGATSVPLAKVAAIRVHGAGSRPLLPEALVQSLVLHYSFDKTRGDKVMDESGRGNHGQIVKQVFDVVWGGERIGPPTRAAEATVVWVEDRFGRKGKALRFNGKGSAVQAPHDVSLTPKTITISVWIRPLGETHDHQVIVSKWVDGRSPASYVLELEPDGLTPRWTTVIQGTQTELIAKVPLRQKTWQHYVGTFDGLTKRVFVNGVQAAETKVSDKPVALNASQSALRIGAHNMPGDYNWLWADLDDVRVFERALTAEEVKELFEAENKRPG